MTACEALDKLLKAYVTYYNIERENAVPPFSAEARFHSHGEQFFLVKSAKLSEAESAEHVFFATPEKLDVRLLNELDETAWNTGLSRVQPHSSHRNTDVVLVILADRVEDEAFAAVKKLRRYKSYSFGFKGWSNYKVIALETSSGRLTYNRQGQSLKKLFRNIFPK